MRTSQCGEDCEGHQRRHGQDINSDDAGRWQGAKRGDEGRERGNNGRLQANGDTGKLPLL